MPGADEIDATVDCKRLVEAAIAFGARRTAQIANFARQQIEDCLTDPGRKTAVARQRLHLAPIALILG
jgi:hypothetical protein